ncbi:auxilin-like protein 1 isoform X2 [Euphorbia lathyris]|uniref:auxilin-like protein 1 isoform X2 n=1 Tax=Euphorbia lathyris TaxID=212925 RepID=UPI003313E7E9
MENPTLSRQPTMLSKKSYNGPNTIASKSIYDDVFGGPPKFGAPTLSPRVEDYTEIFGGFHSSRASSIPVLDLPLVDDEAPDVFFDVRSSGFDYTEVFGGFSGHDFAASYEDLMMMMDQSNCHDDSSDEAWTPTAADNLSEESDHSAKNQCFSNGDSSELIDDCMEFNISYNKASNRCNEDLSNGIRHITQLHDVSGYTFVVDKTTSLPNTGYLQAGDGEDHLNINYSGEMLSGRHHRQVMSQPAKGGTDGLFFGDDVAPHKEFVRNGSMFLTISDVSLRTRPSHLPPPSRPPPALDVEMGDSGKTTPNCESVASEESAGDSSPPYFDVEVDASSSAAASAAAMKDAMKKAQAKLKSAKESMERNRDAFHSRTKLDSKNSRSDKEEKVTEIDNGFGSIKGKGGEGSIQRAEENGVAFSIMEDKVKVKKARQLISDSVEGKYHLNMAKKSEEEKQGRESFSSQGSDFIDVAGEWKEATQFFELVTNKSKKVFDQVNDETVLELDSICYERQKKEKRATVDGLQGHRENGRKVGADHEIEYPETKSGIPIRAFEHDKIVQMTQETCREGRNEKKFSIDLQPGETEKRRLRAYDLQKHSDSVEVIEKAGMRTMKHKDKGSKWKEDNRSAGNVKKFRHGKEDSERKSRNAFELEENEKKFNATYEPAEYEIRLKRVTQPEEKEKTKKAVREREGNEKTLREAVGRKESERSRKETLEKEDYERKLMENRENEERLRRQREATEREENEKRKKETREREENEKRQRELLEREANEKRLKEAKNKEENERRLKENLEKEETQRRQRKALEQEENAKREREENEKRLKQALEKEEMQRRQREAIEKEGNANRERQENEKRLKLALEKEKMQRWQREAAEQEIAKRERVENEMRLQEVLEKEENKRQKEKNEKKQEEAFATEEYAKQQLEVSNIGCKEAFEREEIAERIKEGSDCASGKRLGEVCQKPENCMTSRYFEEVKEIETGLKADEEPETVVNMSEAKCKWKETKTKHVDACDSENQTGLKKMGEDYIELNQAWRLNNNEIDRTTKITGNRENSRELEATKEIACQETSKLLSDPINGEAEVAFGIVEDTVGHGKMLSGVEDVTGTEQKTNEKVKRNFQVTLDTGNQGVKFPYERNERGKNMERLNQEHNKVNFMSAGAVKEPVENGRKIKGAQPDAEVKGNNQRAAHQVHASQSTERKLKNDTLPQEDKESERMKRERDLELERLRKMEEEREREREREKDRMAVDRTILETRERAYAEARERAERAAVERATAEVRERALNDARERLEKACAEAREKSFPDNKASIESRLRAERAAVERATAEARERAFEKAMAERTAFEARDRVERSVSDKFSASRNSGIRPNSSSSDQQSQGAGTFNGSKYQHSSVYSERFGVEGESPQRCKARLERHRRTAERAAKALEEKNMRDLHAQREQAERNRLAETLDADVKRWSSGKEGNLRALLSTLQYILGADSGWQPIPLTEVITAAAVKKAYRKATLCVHPDKLQQRGASIQHKYICEKVFDLLKEAWNKFNSEER